MTLVISVLTREGVYQDYWDAECRAHFAIEEEVLLPGCAHRIPPQDEAVVRVLADHVDIRRRADELRGASPPSLAHCMSSATDSSATYGTRSACSSR